MTNVNPFEQDIQLRLQIPGETVDQLTGLGIIDGTSLQDQVVTALDYYGSSRRADDTFTDQIAAAKARVAQQQQTEDLLRLGQGLI